jgi:N-acetylmuramoyl-L-alanine amidase
VALKLGALIEKELPGVKVVYTRKSDIALGKTLNEDLTARANIANRAEGDFFISIHANAAKSTSVYGVETIIMGESEKETRYNESALYNNNKEELIDMSDENTAAMVRAYIQNLQFTYGEYSEMMARIMQSHYAKGGRNARRVNRQLLKVLYATDMPSVLTEIGFMTNPKELAYMSSEKGQRELAQMLCNAVKEYVTHINKLSANTAKVEDVETNETATPKPQLQPVAVPKLAAESITEGYTIQVLASDKRVKADDSQFKSYRGKIKCYEGSGVLKYKYCYGKFSSQAEAQRQVAVLRDTFKGAFVVRFKDDRIVK